MHATPEYPIRPIEDAVFVPGIWVVFLSSLEHSSGTIDQGTRVLTGNVQTKTLISPMAIPLNPPLTAGGSGSNPNCS